MYADDDSDDDPYAQVDLGGKGQLKGKSSAADKDRRREEKRKKEEEYKKKRDALTRRKSVSVEDRMKQIIAEGAPTKAAPASASDNASEAVGGQRIAQRRKSDFETYAAELAELRESVAKDDDASALANTANASTMGGTGMVRFGSAEVRVGTRARGKERRGFMCTAATTRTLTTHPSSLSLSSLLSLSFPTHNH